eukprot:scaffold11443_cov116-Cylindrotheca_fusiformis.AAC.1
MKNGELNVDGVIISSRDVPITLPNLKYGYRSEPFQWNELREIIEVEKDLAKLSRSETQQRDYEVFRHHLRLQYNSAIDYILISKLGFDRVQKNGLWHAEPRLADFGEVRKVLVPNDFPYYMADGIVHYVLWKTKETVTAEDINEAREQLRTMMKLDDILHWVNPPHLKSLPEIDHVHFLCLLDKSCDFQKAS